MHFFAVIAILQAWGISAAGSVPHWQCGGHGFESRILQGEECMIFSAFLFFITETLAMQEMPARFPEGNRRKQRRKKKETDMEF